jgi:DNA-binding ferritin-like protein
LALYLQSGGGDQGQQKAEFQTLFLNFQQSPWNLEGNRVINSHALLRAWKKFITKSLA